MARRHHGDVERFDEWSTTYDRGPGQYFFGRVHRPVVDAVCSGRVTPRRVVDLGCGTGRLLEALLPRLTGAERFEQAPRTATEVDDPARRHAARADRFDNRPVDPPEEVLPRAAVLARASATRASSPRASK